MEFSPSHRKKLSKGNSCCVPLCKSTKKINRNLSFHKVPKRGSAQITRKNIFDKFEVVDKRTECLQKLNIADEDKELIVCSLHFSASDYTLPDMHTKLRCLKKNSAPLPVNITKSKQDANNRRKQRQSDRWAKFDQNKSQKSASRKESTKQDVICNVADGRENLGMMTADENEESQQHQQQLTVLLIPDENADETLESNRTEVEHCGSDCEELSQNLDDHVERAMENVESKKISYSDIGTQVASGDLVTSFIRFIQTESDLMTACGIKSFKILNELVAVMDEIYPVKKRYLLTSRDCIILTLTKLKQDMSFSYLALLFRNQVSEVTVRNVFYKTVRKLSTILQSTIMRVPKEEILRNIPKCFKSFGSTTTVLDCTEIKMQKPKCLKCRLKFYSNYKGDLTVKFMTEVTPGGIITYVSDSFGGRASDKCIFNHSGILKHLESTRDAVMVDKGFLIDDECAEHRIRLIRPPFLRKKDQLSESEAVQNREIASARVHIERMNQRIKQFALLNNKLPWHFINYVDDIFIICCGLANLGTPILGDDKFL